MPPIQGAFSKVQIEEGGKISDVFASSLIQFRKKNISKQMQQSSFK